MRKESKWLLSILILLGSCAVSGLLAFGNYYYFKWVYPYFFVTDDFLKALLYSSFLLVIGFVVIIFKPGFYGFKIGESLKKWRLVLLVTTIMFGFTVLCLSIVERTPYSGANWAVEMILVPLTEEAMWRGILFAWIFLLLGKLHTPKACFVLTIVYSSLAFGFGHFSNALVHPMLFVIMQMIFAATAGAFMGYLRLKTKSVYPAMLVHAVFNLAAILF